MIKYILFDVTRAIKTMKTIIILYHNIKKYYYIYHRKQSHKIIKCWFSLGTFLSEDVLKLELSAINNTDNATAFSVTFSNIFRTLSLFPYFFSFFAFKTQTFLLKISHLFKLNSFMFFVFLFHIINPFKSRRHVTTMFLTLSERH